MVVMVAVMMPEDNRRQGYAQRKGRTGNHGGRSDGLLRHIILLIHRNGAAFFIRIGGIGGVGRGAGYPTCYGIVVAGTQCGCDKHSACPSVGLLLHGERRSLLSGGLHSVRRGKTSVLLAVSV